MQLPYNHNHDTAIEKGVMRGCCPCDIHCIYISKSIPSTVYSQFQSMNISPWRRHKSIAIWSKRGCDHKILLCYTMYRI